MYLNIYSKQLLIIDLTEVFGTEKVTLNHMNDSQGYSEQDFATFKEEDVPDSL
jgi:hypothetical protein